MNYPDYRLLTDHRDISTDDLTTADVQAQYIVIGSLWDRLAFHIQTIPIIVVGLGLIDDITPTVEQYNGKTSLILGGAFPEGEEGETPSETRETVKKIIKEKLKVDMKGEIVACHRLRNKKRVVVKFQDHDDREAVYQSKFDQGGQPGEKITVHENLTEKRAKMITMLEEMRKRKEVLNYYTRNGNIMARDSAEKRYTRIQPWLSEKEVKATLQKAANKTTQQSNQGSNFMRSQTLSDIPKGFVASKTTNLEEYVVPSTRSNRQTKKGN